MNLASKLDRLRGKAVSDDADDDALVARLEHLHRVTSGARAAANAGGRATSAEMLAEMVGARLTAHGVLISERTHALPPAVPGSAMLGMLPEVWDLPAADWVYIDTETTGLSGGVGNLAFMVGVARYAPDAGLHLRQYLLDNFAAEPAMLRDLTDWIGADAVLVSYNGKCFDLPLLAARLRMHRLADDLGGRRHLDLMYGVRRAFRRCWPDCRLQTAEKRLLSLHRTDDLPGAEAPATWRAWLDHGDAVGLRRTLAHNLQDVVSLALLHHRLPDVYAGRDAVQADPAAIARAWCDAGQEARACRVLERAADRLDDAAQLQLAALYRRRGDWTRAERIWRALHRRGNAVAAAELSKYYEHRVRDYRRALGFAGDCDVQERSVRLARLAQKIGSNLSLPW